MSRLFGVAASRPGKWVLALVWLLAAAMAGSVSSRFQAAQKNDPASYLPGSAESSRALTRITRISGGDVITPAVIVFHRAAGLIHADVGTISADRAALNDRLPKTGVPAGVPFRSNDGTAALLSFGLRLHDDDKALSNEVKLIRDVVHRAPAGLDARVTGPAGSSYDAAQVFKSINGTLLLVTVSLIFVLLVLIYRSPIFWFIPLLAVGFAEIASQGIGYLLTRQGITVNGQSAGILTVLVFGAGTDYALLLVSRYREELRRHPDRHDAMRLTLQRVGPVIFASGATVIAALLCLLAAQVNGTRGLGPIAAMGVALAILSALTLLPALLLIFGRRAFWPFVPRYESQDADPAVRGVWRGIGDRLERRHRPVAIGVLALLVILCAGILSLNTSLTSGNGYRGTVESKVGQKLLGAHYPAGASAPVQIVVSDQTKVAAVETALAASPGASRGPAALGPVLSRNGDSVFDLTLAADPSSQRAFDLIAPLRQVARAAGGPGTLVGGTTAQERDLRSASTRDRSVVVPMILIVVFLILALLLRAVVAPAVLIATVLLSYGAALGTGVLLFNHVFHYPGEDPSLVLFTFLFLVALGVDYNIFLMARVREEAQRADTRQGVIRGLAVTGAVITSAGIVLAGTFSALASLPLVSFTEIGFVIAFGVLLDTFLVRTILVPALVLELDRRVWWPSSLGRRA
ncbi:MAG: putative drug exporter of the superfamily [Solirubrobacteraceae bacterium]|jgi:RND superfamily putative drug exporter|nr:putative drug exporter of the superfamily [Solirubrobacteraceae bacterium]